MSFTLVEHLLGQINIVHIIYLILDVYKVITEFIAKLYILFQVYLKHSESRWKFFILLTLTIESNTGICNWISFFGQSFDSDILYIL